MERIIKMTFGEFADMFGMSDESCEIMGLNPYCLNEGTARSEDELYINEEQANLLNLKWEELNGRE